MKTIRTASGTPIQLDGDVLAHGRRYDPAFVPAGKDLTIHSVNPQGELLSTTLRALFPHAFTPDRVEH